MVCRQSVEAIKGFLAIIFAVLSGSENFCGPERIRIKPNAIGIQDPSWMNRVHGSKSVVKLLFFSNLFRSGYFPKVYWTSIETEKRTDGRSEHR